MNQCEEFFNSVVKTQLSEVLRAFGNFQPSPVYIQPHVLQNQQVISQPMPYIQPQFQSPYFNQGVSMMVPKTTFEFAEPPLSEEHFNVLSDNVLFDDIYELINTETSVMQPTTEIIEDKETPKDNLEEVFSDENLEKLASNVSTDIIKEIFIEESAVEVPTEP